MSFIFSGALFLAFLCTFSSSELNSSSRPTKKKEVSKITKELQCIAKYVTFILCKENELSSQLDQCCRTLNSKIDILLDEFPCDDTSAIENLITACCSGINSKIDSLAECAPVSITMPTTISTPGHYCLAHSITSTAPIITINGPNYSDVYLDLNGQTLNIINGVSAIIIDQTFTSTQITIFNGSITGSGSANGIDIISSTSASLCDLKLINLSIHDLPGSGIIVQSPVNKMLIENCVFCSNGTNASISNANDITIIQSTFNGSTQESGIELVQSQNILIQNSLFNNNAASGINANNVNGMLIENSLFNDNAVDGDGSGLALLFCNAVKAKDCSFNNTKTISPTQAIGLIASGSCSQLMFEHCSFNGNINGGIFIEAFSETPSFCLKFLECQINQNQKTGALVIGNINDIIFDHCFSCCNAEGFRTEGFLLAATQNFVSPSIDIINSVAKGNKFVGFALLDGTGIIKENQAINNGVGMATGCGFDDLSFTTSSFNYVANIAKNNGINPANKLGNNLDTNYCLAGLPSSLIGNGPGSFPYNQVTLGLPPRSYWDNITLQ